MSLMQILGRLYKSLFFLYVLFLMCSAVVQVAAETLDLRQDWQPACDRGDLCMVKKDYAHAKAEYSSALEAAEYFGPASNQVQLSLLRLEYALVSAHKINEAEPYYKRSIDLAGRNFGRSGKKVDPEVLVRMSDLAEAYEKESSRQLLGFCLNHTIRLRDYCEPNHERQAKTFATLGLLCANRKDYSGAKAMYEMQMNHLAMKWGLTSVQIVNPLVNVGKMQELLGQYSGAEASFKLARTITSRDKHASSLVLVKMLSQDIKRVSEESKQTQKTKPDAKIAPRPR